jgi:putative pyruvate formate lyase activating enzyme
MTHKTVLRNYQHIIQNCSLPNYLRTKYTPAPFKKTDSTKQLWQIHKDIIGKKQFQFKQDILPQQSLLDLKIELAERIYHSCSFCEHQCHVDRSSDKGICNIKNSTISSAFIHMGEEQMLIPSFTIFFSGCNFQCVFCQNHDISQHPSAGIQANKLKISDYLMKNKHKIRNINWVGGEPTPHVKTILEFLKQIDFPLAQIWNSNMYCSLETMKLLDGVVDLYLTDFKFGNNYCAKQLSGVEKYWETISRNHVFASKNGDVLIRHLLIPNHLNCCTKPVTNWIPHNMDNYVLHIMNQYHPSYKAKNDPVLNSFISNEDYLSIITYATQKNVMLYQ